MSKVLVIEDEDILRESVLTILQAQGFNAVGAEDGHKGLHLAKEFRPDLILCDVRMPGLDGYEVLKALRQDPLTTEMPLLLLTAETMQNVIHQGESLGASGYLTKPFSTAELLEAIAHHLSI
ncbi:MAG TPA: response regulator [Coleofasciculaceae cyanobacterium]